MLKWVRDLIPKICKKPELDNKYRAKKVELVEIWHSLYLHSKKCASGSGKAYCRDTGRRSLLGTWGIVIEDRLKK